MEKANWERFSARKSPMQDRARGLREPSAPTSIQDAQRQSARPTGRRLLRVAGAFEAENVDAAVGRGDGDEHVRPNDADQASAAFHLGEAESKLSGVGAESPLIGEAHCASP